jgi:hypothetical protein
MMCHYLFSIAIIYSLLPVLLLNFLRIIIVAHDAVCRMAYFLLKKPHHNNRMQ